jgi:tetratricopeptide (TPR) repeat protein
VAPDDPEVARDLGLALVELARERSLVTRQLSETALTYLGPAIQRGPTDIAAWEARGQALAIMGETQEALASCKRALDLAPSREPSLRDAARSAEKLGDHPAAIGYWERLRAVNPRASASRFEIARLRSLGNQWEQTAEGCREVLRINPTHINARLLLVNYYLQSGDKKRAQTEFEIVMALRPSDPEAVRRWYLSKSR